MSFDTTPQFVALYRERSAQPPIVLRRRKCDCGRTVTVKQLQQYGKCEACRRGI